MDLLLSVPHGLSACWALTSVKIKTDRRVNFFNKVSLGKDAFMRFDRPHPNTPYDYHHINIAKKYSGINDPHLQISERQFYVRYISFCLKCFFSGISNFPGVLAFDVHTPGCDSHVSRRFRYLRNN